MYRRTIERTLRQIDPDQTGSLYHRIEALKDASALPQTLIDLLHRIRFLGNTAVHDDEDVDPADVTHGREFVHLFLVYTFELPEKIRQATEQTA
ncbi:hypothetical protein ATO1_08655 [Phaeobacter sp. 22II1-1F12B]|nr:hypothetical protein ATO1_08655 [Phaeobacter sp. 22II1-1F12B]